MVSECCGLGYGSIFLNVKISNQSNIPGTLKLAAVQHLKSPKNGWLEYSFLVGFRIYPQN